MRRTAIATPFIATPFIATLAIVGGLLAAPPRSEAAEDPPAVVVTELLATEVTSTGQPLVLPRANARVIVSEYAIAPGAVLPVHKHPFSRYAVVLEGRLQVSRPGQPGGMVYGPGEVVVEMVDEWHYGTNIGTVPVRLIVVDQVEAGTPTTVLQEK